MVAASTVESNSCQLPTLCACAPAALYHTISRGTLKKAVLGFFRVFSPSYWRVQVVHARAPCSREPHHQQRDAEEGCAGDPGAAAARAEGHPSAARAGGGGRHPGRLRRSLSCHAAGMRPCYAHSPACVFPRGGCPVCCTVCEKQPALHCRQQVWQAPRDALIRLHGILPLVCSAISQGFSAVFGRRL